MIIQGWTNFFFNNILGDKHIPSFLVWNITTHKYHLQQSFQISDNQGQMNIYFQW
jgi:hypothetical protein